jgi:sec-independent protein translocase protein TatB
MGRATVPIEMFGVSFTELVLILVVALVVLGPQRLPSMLRTVGLWIHKVRTMTTEVRAQTGIDDLLRQEGIAGGLAEVRAMLRGDPSLLVRPPHRDEPIVVDDPYSKDPMLDATRERPVEGPDAYGALPDDLVDEAALVVAQQQIQPPAAAIIADPATSDGSTHESDGPTVADGQTGSGSPSVSDQAARDRTVIDGQTGSSSSSASDQAARDRTVIDGQTGSSSSSASDQAAAQAPAAELKDD